MAAVKKHIFTQIQKKMFLDLLKKYSNVIENKDTDGASLRAKNVAWDSITREYNSSPYATAQVTNKQLRRLWMNLKQRQREALTKEKQHRMATGGGPSTSSAIIDEDISIIAPALIVGIDDAIDSDTMPESIVTIEIDSQPVSSQQFGVFTPSTSTISDPSTPPPSSVLMSSFSFPYPMPQSPIITTTSANTLPLVITPPPPTVPTPPPPPTTTTPYLLPTVTTPPPPSTTPPYIPYTSQRSSSNILNRQKNNILEKEHRERQRRAEEMHQLEKELIKERIREARAQADLAELLFRQQLSKE